MILHRNEIMQLLAEKYYYFLNSLPFDDDIYMTGMGEARRKFLANLHITVMKKQLPPKYNDWRFSSDYVSEQALKHLKLGKWDSNTLQYDHMVPKSDYIRKVCEAAAKNGTLTIQFIYENLLKNLWVATIHTEENNLLSKLGLRNKMPLDWDGFNIFARYEKAGIELIEHDKSYLYVHIDR
ncbi:hypothetical protein AWM68_17295 [Fictibacillus phosphorivorans]|uniref:Uncharacterized protein n=1 Tax=Fictibacillus phosphorivorans TaxID=1221500 RepID=A0A163S112_9BACL|nr:hypothetical protein [Fictibacillus phosphorivorans]KZE67929.1 hypothetical protein AWM68_17295 [Fictibacillus phosphorivorans]